jgi:hypothetical protein
MGRWLRRVATNPKHRNRTHHHALAGENGRRLGHAQALPDNFSAHTSSGAGLADADVTATAVKEIAPDETALVSSCC